MNSNALEEQPVAEDIGGSFKGLAKLMTLAFQGADLTPLGRTLLERVEKTPGPSSADALADSIILHIMGNHEVAQNMQDQALQFKQLYQLPAQKQPAIRLLAIYAPGDLNANTPLEFLAENSDIELNILYLTPGRPMPKELPAHDVLFVAIGESERNLDLLELLEGVVPSWPCPVLNMPGKIARLARDTASELLHSAPGVAMPMSLRVSREGLASVELHFPLIVRPVDSHAGVGLVKVDNAAAISEYLQTMPQSEFYVSQFIDYSNEDGQFRKYRVVLIDGKPYASHMAISEHWIVHYLSGGMAEQAGKRAEEERFMADFDTDFAVRHHAALRSIAVRTGLDYLVIDCAEAPDGRLLVFEIDSSAVVHAMDSAETFPYKKPQMEKVCRAFRSMLVKAIK